MTLHSHIYIAGVGVSPLSSGKSSKQVTTSLISAATKALLDAGLTYDDVARGVRTKTCRHASDAFQAFDEGGITVDEVEDGRAFDGSFTLVTERGVPCVLVIDAEESNAIAVVLVSEDFLWSRSYLKDSAALINRIKSTSTKNKKENLYDLCRSVWALRGWSKDSSTADSASRRQWTTFELSRADGQSIPPWKEVEHKQDGKYRLSYNPAEETKSISRYDYNAVRAVGAGKNPADDWIQFERKGGDRIALAKL